MAVCHLYRENIRMYPDTKILRRFLTNMAKTNMLYIVSEGHGFTTVFGLFSVSLWISMGQVGGRSPTAPRSFQ